MVSVPLPVSIVPPVIVTVPVSVIVPPGRELITLPSTTVIEVKESETPLKSNRPER